LLPIIITFQSHESEYLLFMEQFFNIRNTACYFLAISFFSVSHIPTFSAKYIYIPRSLSYIFVSLFGVFIVFFVSKPWITLPILGVIYTLTIPVSIGLYIYYTYKAR
jgi:CDP-diacylglycerol--serine O-phosphatidyltransferase